MQGICQWISIKNYAGENLVKSLQFMRFVFLRDAIGMQEKKAACLILYTFF
jgi:hypothetical protein